MMNDFDFDELDKAVSSLADKTVQDHGQLTGDLQVTSGPIAPALRRAAPVPAVADSHADEPKASPAPEPVVEPSSPAPTVTVPTPVSQPARLPAMRSVTNRRGFMDIVPPAARKPVSRTSVVVQPVSKPEDIVPDAASEPESKPADDLPMVIESQPKTNEVKWPDPLDFANRQPDPTPEPPAEPAPSTTPFIPEAKVEKRPLGAYSNFKPAEPAPEPTLAENSKPPENPPISDELTPGQDGTFKEPSAPTLEAPAATDHTPVDADKPADKPQPIEPEAPDMHSAAMMSIPKQYHTPDKPADKTLRPVFDTKEYHPPLLDKAMSEHRGMGMWPKLFIALVILALLAVGGYFVYLYFYSGTK